MVKDEVIKLKGKRILMWFLSFVLLFGIVIFIENRRVLRFIKLDYKSEIPLVYITGNENYGYLRGAVFYNKNHYISTSAKLIGPFIQSNIWNSQIQKPNNFEPRSECECESEKKRTRVLAPALTLALFLVVPPGLY